MPWVLGNLRNDWILQDLLERAKEKNYSWNFRLPGYGDVVVSGRADDVAWILQGNFDNDPKHQLISELDSTP